jgi:hypothetical protein
VIRTNLATRPFYNERAAHVLIALLALVVLAFTLFNVYRIVSLSGRNTALAAETRQDTHIAQQQRQQAAALRSRIDQARLKTVLAGAREANALIDRRTFSWTEFFNLIERTLPDSVMLTSVTPTIEEGRTLVSMVVIGRRAEDLDAFMEQLEATQAFRNVLPRTEDVTEEGLHRVLLTGQYLAPGAPAPAGPPRADEPEPAGTQPPALEGQ